MRCGKIPRRSLGELPHNHSFSIRKTFSISHPRPVRTPFPNAYADAKWKAHSLAARLRKFILLFLVLPIRANGRNNNNNSKIPFRAQTVCFCGAEGIKLKLSATLIHSRAERGNSEGTSSWHLASDNVRKSSPNNGQFRQQPT